MAAGGEALMLKIKSNDGGHLEFKVKPCTKLKKVFLAFCEKKGIEMQAVKFLSPDGRSLLSEKSVEEAELEDGDCLDCMAHVVGGSPSIPIFRLRNERVSGGSIRICQMRTFPVSGSVLN
eukprot:TRINITY_DN8175_c0_g1_i1.p5 TRINITY_DN8175_c0_g1~~TRINITY_DN8175_c0_g1_i1.p5  ORF type:complete len:120 (-),score=14.70 TRINITY_DN8175_c0_g1_i1:354-713(-)